MYSKCNDCFDKFYKNRRGKNIVIYYKNCNESINVIQNKPKVIWKWVLFKC